MAYVNVARLEVTAREWTKDRVREELADFRRKLVEYREAMQQQEEYHEATNYKFANDGWYEEFQDDIRSIERAIGVLRALL
jgi:hypothetical protein